MNRLRLGVVSWLLTAAPLLAGSAKECLNLSATRDAEIYSPGGIQVTVTGVNDRCSDTVHPDQSSFRVRAIGPNGELGVQTGRFQTSTPPGSRSQTKLFVSCDPDRVRYLHVEGQ